MGENDNIPQMTPSFENICRKDENGNEYWSSRDLCGAMGYSAMHHHILIDYQLFTT